MCFRKFCNSGRHPGGIIFSLLSVILVLATMHLLMLLVIGGAHRFMSYFNSQSSELSATEHVETTEELWNRFTQARIRLGEAGETDGPVTEASDTSEEKSPAEENRPDWVDAPARRVGDVYRTVVQSGPFSTVDECYEDLEGRFPKEVQKQLVRIVPAEQRDLVDAKSLPGMGITLSFIMKDICRESYVETIDSSVGEMKQVHVLMEFGPAVEHHLLWTWKSYLRQFRIVLVTKIAVFVLAVLAGAYGLLHLDTWTRGYYTNRLLVGASAAIIAIAVVLFVR